METMNYEIKLTGGRLLKTTPVFDTYWRFAAERQAMFMHRIEGQNSPWTEDPILSCHRFTNAYRASDRVSQYLIKNIIYKGSQEIKEVFFRIILFKIFNKIETWEKLLSEFKTISWKDFSVDSYAQVLDSYLNKGERIYSAAYIMPSPNFGSERKHRNHLRLIEYMMADDAPLKIAEASSLQSVFEILRSYPSLGDFLAFQFAIDLNYSEIINFSEMDFVVAGPGARDGIQKCFAHTCSLTDSEIITIMTERTEDEFKRLGLTFKNLWGRSLQLIDCQNIFCEVSKYARVAHPEFGGSTGRTKIKQKYTPNNTPIPQMYPPKWCIEIPVKNDAINIQSNKIKNYQNKNTRLQKNNNLDLWL